MWLDVLCLRQQQAKAHAEFDQLRNEEGQLDVPTIGNIYRAADRVIRYFNGLGIPLSPHGWMILAIGCNELGPCRRSGQNTAPAMTEWYGTPGRVALL